MRLNFAFLKYLFVLLLILGQQEAFSANTCKQLFALDPKVAKLVIEDNFQQWALWEQKSNYAPFRKSSNPILIDRVSVDANSVNITFLKSTPPSLRKLIGNGDKINWFKHPYNKVSSTPHFHNDQVIGTTEVFFTASRSLALKIDNDYFTLKMPTNFPHGFNREEQPGKATVKEDITDGINRMEYIERVDNQIGLDPKLILAKEVAMVADKATGEGYLFRDLSFMKDGNFYLPALSIPYAGRDIAKLNGELPEVFWRKHYAELLGKAKAKLLLRYGLQMETPNSQNMLIQLDRSLKPTGVIVFRDISDTMLVTQVADGLGERATIEKDKVEKVENTNSIKPFWRNSRWRFNQAGDNSFHDLTLHDWGVAHDLAYIKEIEKELGINLSNVDYVDGNPEFDKIMASDYVKAKLTTYRLKLINKELDKKHRWPRANAN